MAPVSPGSESPRIPARLRVKPVWGNASALSGRTLRRPGVDQATGDERLEIDDVGGGKFRVGANGAGSGRGVGAVRALAAGGVAQYGGKLRVFLRNWLDTDLQERAREFRLVVDERAAPQVFVPDHAAIRSRLSRDDAPHDRLPLPRPLRQMNQRVGAEVNHSLGAPMRRLSPA